MAPSGRVLLQKAKNIFPPRQPVQAALSHTSQQQAEKFVSADCPAFDDTGDLRQIGQQRRLRQRGFAKREAVQRQLDVRAVFEINLRWLMSGIWTVVRCRFKLGALRE